MNDTIGLVAIDSYTPAYFLKEYYLYSIKNQLPISNIIIDSISFKNKALSYGNMDLFNIMVEKFGESLKTMITKANKVLILCNVIHLYKESILLSFPEVEPYFIDIIGGVVLDVCKSNINNLLVLCSENAKKTKIFEHYFSDTNISVKYADRDQNLIHSLMSYAENNIISENTVYQLYRLCLKYKDYNIFFACTELSIIYGQNKALFSNFSVFDTIDSAIYHLSEPPTEI